MRLGCRWSAEDTAFVPKRRSVEVPLLDEVHVPRFRYREVFCPEAEGGDFAAKLMPNGQFGHRTYTRPLKERHGGAVYFLSGYNNEARPAMPRESRLRALGEAVVSQIERVWLKGLAYVLISHVDGGYFYNKGEDAKMIRKGGSPGAPFMDLCCWVARKIGRLYSHISQGVRRSGGPDAGLHSRVGRLATAPVPPP